MLLESSVGEPSILPSISPYLMNPPCRPEKAGRDSVEELLANIETAQCLRQLRLDIYRWRAWYRAVTGTSPAPHSSAETWPSHPFATHNALASPVRISATYEPGYKEIYRPAEPKTIIYHPMQLNTQPYFFRKCAVQDRFQKSGFFICN